jgi:hypothetical protein
LPLASIVSAAGIPRQIANLRDATVSDREVGLYGFSACAIDKGATCNH